MDIDHLVVINDRLYKHTAQQDENVNCTRSHIDILHANSIDSKNRLNVQVVQVVFRWQYQLSFVDIKIDEKYRTSSIAYHQSIDESNELVAYKTKNVFHRLARQYLIFTICRCTTTNYFDGSLENCRTVTILIISNNIMNRSCFYFLANICVMFDKMTKMYIKK
jgi:hypothetical protein